MKVLHARSIHIFTETNPQVYVCAKRGRTRDSKSGLNSRQRRKEEKKVNVSSEGEKLPVQLNTERKGEKRS